MQSISLKLYLKKWGIIMSNIIKYDGLLAFHPGTYIEDVIENLNITQREFADRLDINPKVLSELVNGEANLSPEVALKLEKLTGVEYQSWMNLQNSYDRKKLEIEKKMQEDEQEVAELIDLKYFKKNGFITDRRYACSEKIEELRNLFNVSNLSYLTTFNPSVSYRSLKEFDEKTIVNSNVMLEIATNIARNKTENKLNKKNLEANLPLIKQMLNKSDSSFYSTLKDVLLDCGIVLVGLPSLKNSSLQGATKKFKNGSVLLLITDRNKAADIFWFSLMHEIAHILFGDFYTDKDDDQAYENKELKADDWAADFLIDKEKYKKFIERAEFNRNSIVKFSEEEEILPCILSGRLKKEGYIGYNQLNDLNISYHISIN